MLAIYRRCTGANVLHRRMLGWASVLFAIQQWLSETPAQKAQSASPAYLSVGMAVLSLGVVSLECLTSDILPQISNCICRDTCLSSCHLLLAAGPEAAPKLPQLHLLRNCLTIRYLRLYAFKRLQNPQILPVVTPSLSQSGYIFPFQKPRK